MDFEKWIMSKSRTSHEAGQTRYFSKDADSRGAVHQLVVSSFDPDFYRDTYRDLADLDGDGAIGHFWQVGWLEGRNPNGWFDTCSYLEANEDVRLAGVNPLLHYAGWGRKEGRSFRTPIPFRQINQTLFDDPDLDWFAIVAPAFDKTFYASQFHETIPENLNLLAHYLYRGWRENRLPRESYMPAQQPLQIGELTEFVPPIVIELFAERAPPVMVRRTQASAPARPEAPQVRLVSRQVVAGSPIVPARRQLIELEYRKNPLSEQEKLEISRQIPTKAGPKDISRYQGEERAVAAEFDGSYYLAVNPDVKDAGVDPLEHYFYTGWTEGRDPTSWFSTSYYLSTNPDVAAAQINPFWHYIVAGKAELRAPKKQGSIKRNILDTLQTPQQRTADYITPDHTRLRPSELRSFLVEAVAGRDGMVWSSSHDCYPVIVGGTQIFIGDEERLFGSLDVAYIHASPLRGSLLMNDASAEETLTRLVMNGKIVGVATDAEIAAALSMLGGRLPEDRTYVVHSVLGHSLPGMLAIHGALKPANAFFWLHDYSSICSGYNLLRNDIEYCHAPPVGSQACNVCIFGQSRAHHVSLVSTLFERCDFTVAAPSDVALSIWKSGSQLPHRSSIVLDHCTIEDLKSFPDERAVASIGMLENPVRVAFVGYPTSQKGWPSFAAVVDKTRGQGGYQFFHFAKPGAFLHSEGVTAVEAEVTAGHRHAMSDLLAAHRIDLVVMAAPWPETFSYVLFEALAAGCDIITLPNSGNVATVVGKTGRGFVFADDAEIVDFFQTYSAISYVRARARYGIERGRLVHQGTTAAVHIKTAQGA
jgi:glycosyltransferase involved in cell wall biosynthesis